jgi:hypothetical protein
LREKPRGRSHSPQHVEGRLRGTGERRRAVREKTDISAHIILPANQFVKCRVTNFSTYGALLAVPSAFGLPDTFELRGLARNSHVRVVRRGVGHAAIIFV